MQPIKINIKPLDKDFNSNTVTNDKIQNAQKILDNQREKMMIKNKGSFGLANNIGFLNNNISTSKPLLISKDLNDKAEDNNINKDNDEFFLRKNPIQANLNTNFIQRLSGTKISTKKEDEIEEIKTISISKENNELNKIKINSIIKDKDEDTKDNKGINDINNKISDIKIINFNDKLKELNSNLNDKNILSTKTSIVLDKNDPKNQLYYLVNNTKDEIDTINLKFFLYT